MSEALDFAHAFLDVLDCKPAGWRLTLTETDKGWKATVRLNRFSRKYTGEGPTGTMALKALHAVLP